MPRFWNFVNLLTQTRRTAGFIVFSNLPYIHFILLIHFKAIIRHSVGVIWKRGESCSSWSTPNASMNLNKQNILLLIVTKVLHIQEPNHYVPVWSFSCIVLTFFFNSSKNINCIAFWLQYILAKPCGHTCKLKEMEKMQMKTIYLFHKISMQTNLLNIFWSLTRRVN